MNAVESQLRLEQSPFAYLRESAATQWLIRHIAATEWRCETRRDVWLAKHRLESNWKSPVIDDYDWQSVIAGVATMRLDCTIPAPPDELPYEWPFDNSDDEPDFPTLTDSERVLIGEWLQEHHEALLRVAGRYFHSKGVAFGAIAYASEYAVSECYLYACEQVSRESLPVESLSELKRWCGILSSVRGRYFDLLSAVTQERDAYTTLDAIIGRSASDYSAELSGEELDYILGIDDTTPEWIIDTIAALLAYPDSTDDERAESLGIAPAAFRKRLERTRNYFATRG